MPTQTAQILTDKKIALLSHFASTSWIPATEQRARLQWDTVVFVSQSLHCLMESVACSCHLEFYPWAHAIADK